MLARKIRNLLTEFKYYDRIPSRPTDVITPHTSDWEKISNSLLTSQHHIPRTGKKYQIAY